MRSRQELIDYLVMCAGLLIKDDAISRVDVIKTVHDEMYDEHTDKTSALRRVMNAIGDMPAVDALVITRCKDCKHRPRRIEKNGGNWFDLEFPDNRCPCQGDDGRYNWMPDDNWFCGNGARMDEE